jgi:hypothetical protein
MNLLVFQEEFEPRVTVGIGCFQHVGLKVFDASDVVGKNTPCLNAAISIFAKHVDIKRRPLLKPYFTRPRPRC